MSLKELMGAFLFFQKAHNIFCSYRLNISIVEICIVIESIVTELAWAALLLHNPLKKAAVEKR